MVELVLQKLIPKLCSSLKALYSNKDRQGQHRYRQRQNRYGRAQNRDSKKYNRDGQGQNRNSQSENMDKCKIGQTPNIVFNILIPCSIPLYCIDATFKALLILITTSIKAVGIKEGMLPVVTDL